MDTTNDNPFAGNGIKAKFAEHFYDLLMKGDWVTYDDICEAFDSKEFKNCGKKTNFTGYGEMKKAVSEIKKKLGGSIEDIKEGRTKKYRYIGKDDDPLREERIYSDKKNMEEIVDFIKKADGFMPVSWTSHFLSGSTVLYDLNNRKRQGLSVIYSGGNPNLKNLDLLPTIYEKIITPKVICILYHPYGKKPFYCHIHPHVLKEYNGRWFLFGKTKNKNGEWRISNFPLDRIEKIQDVEDEKYEAAESGYYEKFFNSRIGISGDASDDVEEQLVTIHTHSEYMHGLLTTKPLHHSQKTVKDYEKGGHGIVTLSVVPNNELMGQLRLYGGDVEVAGPEDLRERFKQELIKQLKRHEDNHEE